MKYIYIKTTQTAEQYQVWSIYERSGTKTRWNETGYYFRQMRAHSALGRYFQDASLVRVHKKGEGLKVKGSKLRGIPLYQDLKSALDSLGYEVHPA